LAMDINSRIYVAGHTGLVGSAIVRCLRKEGFNNLLLISIDDLNLISQPAVDAFFASEKPEYVFLVAGRVGGILANKTFPASFIYENLMIEANVIHAAHRSGVKKLLFTGSSCIYPKLAPQPLKEAYLLTSELEPTNEWYAVAKIAGIKLCQAYRRQYGLNAISAMPTNLYGPGDNFDLNSSHVLPALIRKFHEAKLANAPRVAVWGSGTPRREFLHVDDLAAALTFLMRHYDGEEIINVGTGCDLTIREVAELIRDVVGFKGDIIFDSAMPDGTPRKLLDVSRIHALGWSAEITLPAGIAATYGWFLSASNSLPASPDR
jgi:GDP-L-fucose synthase